MKPGQATANALMTFLALWSFSAMVWYVRGGGELTMIFNVIGYMAIVIGVGIVTLAVLGLLVGGLIDAICDTYDETQRYDW